MLGQFGHQRASARRCCWHYCVQIGHVHRPCIFLFFHFCTADMLARWAASLKGPCARTGWRVQGKTVFPANGHLYLLIQPPVIRFNFTVHVRKKMYKWCWSCTPRNSPLPWRSLLQTSLVVDSWVVWCAVPCVHIQITALAVLAFQFGSSETLVKAMPPCINEKRTGEQTVSGFLKLKLITCCISHSPWC